MLAVCCYVQARHEGAHLSFSTREKIRWDIMRTLRVAWAKAKQIKAKRKREGGNEEGRKGF